MKIAALLAALACAVLPVQAATLKPLSTLTGASIRLSDLWDGVTNDRTLAPAPAPGGRITVPSAQLAAIARDYGVDWHPASGGDRVILERPGRSLTRDDIKPAIVAALPGAGLPADAELEIGAVAADPVPAEAKLDITVAQFDLDAATGRFAALLTVAASGLPDTQLRVSGRAQEMTDMPVLRHRLLPGDVIAASDLGWGRVRASLARGDVVRTPAQAIGQAARRTLQSDQPLQLAELGRALIVQKGEAVVLSLETPGLTVTARAVATEPGGLGDHIRVLNELARTTVEAELTGRGRARVIPGTSRPATRLVAAR